MQFFQDALGLTVTARGVPVTDTQFTRYAQFTLRNGTVLEVVEPAERVRQVYTAPIVSFTVDDVLQARRELEGRQVPFVAPIFRTKVDGAGPIFVLRTATCTNFKEQSTSNEDPLVLPDCW